MKNEVTLKDGDKVVVEARRANRHGRRVTLIVPTLGGTTEVTLTTEEAEAIAHALLDAASQR